MRILLLLAVPVLLAQQVSDDLRARYHHAQHELFLTEQLASRARERYDAVMKDLNEFCGTQGKRGQIESGQPGCVK